MAAAIPATSTTRSMPIGLPRSLKWPEQTLSTSPAEIVDRRLDSASASTAAAHEHRQHRRATR